MLSLLICCILTLYLTHLYRKWSDHWKSRGVPHEKPYPLIGNLYSVITKKQHLFETYRSLYTKFSTPVFGIFLLYKPALVVRSPALLKKILVQDSDKFLNRNLPFNYSVDPLAFRSLFFARNDQWRASKVKFSSTLTPFKVKSMFSLIRQHTDQFCSVLKEANGRVLEVKELVKKYSISVMAACLLGTEIDCYENPEFYKMADKLLDPTNPIRLVSTFHYFFVSSLVNILKLTFLDKFSSDYLTKIFNATCTRRRKEERKHDFVQSVLENDLAGPEATSQVLTFFAAGTLTIPRLLSFILYELAMNESLQITLREEIQSVESSYEGIQRMKYLDMVVKEAIRKYHLAGILSRVAEEDYLVEETNFTIEKGTLIIVPVVGLHYDPEYFPDPYKFDPERFGDQNKKKIPKMAYLPFGDGPRRCVGQNLALVIIKATLVSTLSKFRFERVEKTVKAVEFDCDYPTLAQIKGELYLKVTEL